MRISDWSQTCALPICQWVIEDRFPAGRPAHEKVGVIFTPRVHDFETMKICIRNGCHAFIGYPAALLGIEHVHEAIADGRIAAFLGKIETDYTVQLERQRKRTKSRHKYASLRTPSTC